MSVDIARALLVDGRYAKGCRSGCSAVNDTSWHVVSGKEPVLYVVRCPFCDIEPATYRVETSAVVVRSGTAVELAATAGVAVDGLVAVTRLEVTRLATPGNGTVIAGVQRYGVVRLQVDSFNDINLSVRWPVWADQPVCRPHATAKRHMHDVKDEKTVGVRVVAHHPN